MNGSWADDMASTTDQRFPAIVGRGMVEWRLSVEGRRLLEGFTHVIREPSEENRMSRPRRHRPFGPAAS